MGLLGKLVDGINRADSAKTSAEIWLFKDRRFDRAEKLAADGITNEAVVTGISARRDDHNVSEYQVRLEWFDPSPRVGGVYFDADMPLAARIGSTLRIAADGEKVAIDPKPMVGTPGAPQDPGRTSKRVPEQGVQDTSLNANVRRRYAKWEPAEATIASIEQVTALGMKTQNWHITLTKADGTTASAERSFVPPYVRWYIAPGETVPIVVDPKNPAKAEIVWPQLAVDRAARGGTWKDAPPPGSAAAQELEGWQPPRETSDVYSDVPPTPVALAPSAESAAAIEGVTIEQWAMVEASLQKHPVSPNQYDAAATERFGIAPDRYTAIKQQWEARMHGGDWRVGAAFGEAFAAAQRQLK